ncbi:transporter [Flavobacteriaceae bacterium F89]|uniref:Transporter n=1 Tax=Cerina litoralis TaxID=2874477 RepID=A0AAE3EZE4_9FLAO|nr:transporter [Cerina litoralis]MCG2462536.1 transporter [Cerina litoralis]
MKKYLTALLAMTTLLLCAQENTNPQTQWTDERPDGHGPISVVGDHMHQKGEWMFNIEYVHSYMEGLQMGNQEISPAKALDKYMVVPEKMTMDMQMLAAMYAPSDKLTLMAMTMYMTMDMDLLMRNGNPFNVRSSGIGDTQLAGLLKIWDGNRQTLHGLLGFSLPTGSIQKKDVTPMSAPGEAKLPYGMQMGSGTYDGNLSLTYLGQGNLFSWGSQLSGILRFGQNDRDYRLGNQLHLNNWLAYKTADWLSFSGRLEWTAIGSIKGVDPNLNPIMSATADTDNSGETLINAGLGFNTRVPKGTLEDLRFAFEYAFPIYQNLYGVQLKNKRVFTLGLQYSF